MGAVCDDEGVLGSGGSSWEEASMQGAVPIPVVGLGPRRWLVDVSINAFCYRVLALTCHVTGVMTT